VVRAKEVGVPVYLESSPEAVGLYRRLGFTELKRLDVLQGDSGYVLTVFIKYAEASQGKGRAENYDLS
jgi:hypothetical protein